MNVTLTCCTILWYKLALHQTIVKFFCLFLFFLHCTYVVDTVVVRALLSQITCMDGKVFLDGGIIQTSFMTVLLLYYNFGAQV